MVYALYSVVYAVSSEDGWALRTFFLSVLWFSRVALFSVALENLAFFCCMEILLCTFGYSLFFLSMCDNHCWCGYFGAISSFVDASVVLIMDFAMLESAGLFSCGLDLNFKFVLTLNLVVQLWFGLIGFYGSWIDNCFQPHSNFITSLC